MTARPSLQEREFIEKTKPYSYLIFKKHGYYFAVNGEFGELEFFDEYLHNVLNAIFTKTGGNVHLVFLKSKYKMYQPAVLPERDVSIDFNHSTLETHGCYAFTRTTPVYRLHIKNLHLRPYAEGVGGGLLNLPDGGGHIYLENIIVDAQADFAGSTHKLINIVRGPSDVSYEIHLYHCSINGRDKNYVVYLFGSEIWIDCVKFGAIEGGKCIAHVGQRVIVSNCGFENVTLRVKDSVSSIIMGNWFSKCWDNAIIVDGGHDVQIIGNRIDECRNKEGTYAELIYLINSYNCIVALNTLQTSLVPEQGVCLFEEPGSHDNIIVFNDVSRPAITKISPRPPRSGTIVLRNKGDYRETLAIWAAAVEVGVNDTYGAATTWQPQSNLLRFFRGRITTAGTFSPGETVTVKVECVFADGSTKHIEKSYTATVQDWLTESNIFALWKDGNAISKINIYAKTNLSSTSVAVYFDAYGCS